MIGARAANGLTSVSSPESIMTTTFERLDELDAVMRARTTPPAGVTSTTAPQGMSTETVVVGTLARLEANQRAIQSALDFMMKCVIAFIVATLGASLALSLTLVHLRVTARAEVEQLRFEQRELTQKLEVLMNEHEAREAR